MSGQGTVPTAILREGQVGPELAGTAGQFLAFDTDGRHVKGVPAPGGGGGTPLSSWLVVDPANAAGTHNGAFSGNLAFDTVTGAAAALTADGGQLAVLTGDYSLEAPIALAHVTSIQGVGLPLLPALHPAADLYLYDLFDQTTVAPTANVQVNGQNANIVAGGAAEVSYFLTGNSVLTQTGATGIGNVLMFGGELSGPITAIDAVIMLGGTIDGGLVTANGFELTGVNVGASLTSTGGMTLMSCRLTTGITITSALGLTIDRDTYEQALANGVTFAITGQIVVQAPTRDYKVGPVSVDSGQTNVVLASLPAALVGNLAAAGTVGLLADVLIATNGYSTGFWLMGTLVNDGLGGFTIVDSTFTPINPNLAVPNAQVTNLEFHINGANLEVRVTTDPGSGNGLNFVGHIEALGQS